MGDLSMGLSGFLGPSTADSTRDSAASSSGRRPDSAATILFSIEVVFAEYQLFSLSLGVESIILRIVN